LGKRFFPIPLWFLKSEWTMLMGESASYSFQESAAPLFGMPKIVIDAASGLG
jgi:hypothetical protein